MDRQERSWTIYTVGSKRELRRAIRSKQTLDTGFRIKCDLEVLYLHEQLRGAYQYEVVLVCDERDHPVGIPGFHPCIPVGWLNKYCPARVFKSELKEVIRDIARHRAEYLRNMPPCPLRLTWHDASDEPAAVIKFETA